MMKTSYMYLWFFKCFSFVVFMLNLETFKHVYKYKTSF